MSRYGAAQYKQTSVATASKEQVLLMLYEGAIRFTKKSIECIENKDMPGKGKFIGKVHDIINELSNSLDFEVGGAIAKELDRLYTFMVEQLIKANVDNSTESLKQVQKMLETLHEAWKAAVEKLSKEAK